MKIAGVNLSGVSLLPVLGTVLAGQLFASQFTGYTLYGAALCAALCFAGICVRRYMVSLAGAFCGIGMLAVWISEPAENGFTGHEVTLNGVVIEATPRAESQRLIIDLNACEGFDERIRTLVYYRNSEPPVEAGDIVRVTGVMTEPFDKPVVEGEFSMEGFTRRRGITGRMNVEYGDMEIVKEASGFIHSIRMLRRRISDVIHASGVSGDCAATLDAILLGNASELDADTREKFSRAGLAHVLALSGTHVAVMAFFASLIFFPFRLAGRRKWAMGGVIAFLWFYVLLTGGAPSVVRAAIMATVVMAGAMLERMSSPVNSLCAAALLILLFDPRALMAPGFQLSFLAVAGILMFAPELTFGRGTVRLVSQWLAVSFGAVVATAPLAAWHFHVIPFYFLLANMAVALVLPWFMGAGVLLVFIAGAGLQAGWIASCADLMCRYIMYVSTFVSDIPGAFADKIYFSPWALVGWYAGVVVLWMALRLRRPACWVACVIILLFATGLTVITRPEPTATEVVDLPDPYRELLLVREGDRCLLFTDAKPKLHEAIRERAEWRLHDYMAMHGVDSLEVREMPHAFGEIGRAIVGGAQNGIVPNHKVDVNGDSGGK